MLVQGTSAQYALFSEGVLLGLLGAYKSVESPASMGGQDSGVAAVAVVLRVHWGKIKSSES